MSARLSLILTPFRAAAAGGLLTALIYFGYGLSQPAGRWQLAGDAFLNSFPTWNTDAEHDSAAYNRPATEILKGGLPRSRSGVLFLYAPVYAYFVALCYGLGGIRILPLALAQAALGGATAYLMALTAWRLMARSSILAVVATGLLLAVNLRIGIYTICIYPTMLLLFLIAVAFTAATQIEKTHNLLLFAVAITLGIYTQAGFLLLASAAGVWLLVRYARSRDGRLLLGALVILVGACGKFGATMLDVGGRQEDHLRQGARGILWEANNPYYESMGPLSAWERRPGNPFTKWQVSGREEERYQHYLARTQADQTAAALLWIRENPGQYAKLCWVRLRTTLGPVTGQMGWGDRMIATAAWLMIFPAGVVGLYGCRKHPVSVLAGLLIGAVLLSDMLVIVEWHLRYRLPMDLVLAAYAGVAYAQLVELWRTKWKRQ